MQLKLQLMQKKKKSVTGNLNLLNEIVFTQICCVSQLNCRTTSRVGSWPPPVNASKPLYLKLFFSTVYRSVPGSSSTQSRSPPSVYRLQGDSTALFTVLSHSPNLPSLTTDFLILLPRTTPLLTPRFFFRHLQTISWHTGPSIDRPPISFFPSGSISIRLHASTSTISSRTLQQV